MNHVLAIAALTVRAAFRSRAMPCLLVVLAAVILGLPMAIKADGTAAGEIRLLLQYVTGLCFLITGAAILWLGCAAVSEEIRDRQIHLLIAKPVRRVEIWLGKWIGLGILGAMASVFVGIGVWAEVRWRAGVVGAPEDRRALAQEVLVGRTRLLPERRDVSRDVEARLEVLLKQGVLSPEMSRERAVSLIRREILSRENSLAAGGAKQWRFEIRGPMTPTTDVTLCARFHRMGVERKPVAGRWTVAAADGRIIAESAMRGNLSGTHKFTVPAQVFASPCVLTVMFENGPEGQSLPVLFQAETGGVEMLVNRSSFEMNLFRALTVLCGYLLLLAALGVTMGSCFSFSVGAFTGVGSVVAAYMSLGLSRTVPLQDRGLGIPAVDVVIRTVLTIVDRVSDPVLAVDPVGLLSDGMLVSWGHTGEALLILVVLYPLALGGIGVLVLAGRELALPES